MKKIYLIALLFVAFATFAQDKYSGGDGSEASPYQISTLDDLKELCQDQPTWGIGGPGTSLYYILTNNIDASSTQYWDDSDDNEDGDFYNDPNDETSAGTNDGWRPLGHSWGQYFMAAFDGQGYEIDGLYMDRDDSFGYAGFIGTTYYGDAWRRETGTIQNIGLTNVNFTSQADKVAGFIAELNSDLIINCYVTGSVTTATGDVAGFVVRMQGQNSDNHIINCYTNVLVTWNGPSTSYGYVGGFGSYMQKVTGGDTKISGCFSLGDVISSSTSSSAYIGGFFGRMASGTIENCFSRGDVTQGGTSSRMNAFIASASGYSALPNTSNCYSVGNVYRSDGDDPTNKGFSYFSNGTHTGHFWDSEASNQLTGNGATAKTTSEMKTQSTFTDAGWDFTTIWDIDPVINDGYPYIIGLEPPLPTIMWDGSTNSDWNTASNWVGDAVPTSGENVIITNSGTQPILESGETADCYNLTVNNGATLTIESGGSLISSGTITNSGCTNIEHSMTDGKWHLVSSPVSIKAGLMFEGDYLQYYNETLESDNYIEISNGHTYLTACKGYAWRNSEKSDFVFTGTPFTGDQSISTTAVQENGWNLVGNPYPSSIDWNLLDDTYGSVYTFVDNGVNSGWRYYNDGASTNGGSRYIPPMQGFFISTGENGTFAVSNSHRTHSGADGYVKSESQLSKYIKLKITSNNKIDETFIQFGEQYLLGFDQLYDALKMDSETDENLMIYSKTTEGNLCIDRRPEINQIQLGVKNPENSVTSISLLESGDMTKISLEDTKLNSFHDLTQEAYTFNWQTTDSEERFILHLKATGLEDIEDNNIQVYSSNGQVYVSMDKPEAYDNLVVYDLAGRVVYENKIANQNIQSFDINHLEGAYLVQLIGRAKIKTKKIIL